MRTRPVTAPLVAVVGTLVEKTITMELAPVLTGLALAACRGEPTAVGEPWHFGGAAPATAAITAAVDGVPILALIDDAQIPNAYVRARLSASREQPWAAAVRVGRLAPDADTVLAVGRSVAFTVYAGRRLVFAEESGVVNPNGSIFWVGTRQGGRHRQANAVLTALGLTAGLHVVPPVDAAYTIQPLGGGYQAIGCVEPSKSPAID